ncbi:hypothetical protein BIW11_06367 [Tropilaelaps mercedesae]|uniref:Uncharacterized protein n=1 Tax=Tropilaelaps mercedesae TaxID=418985 RepID=A0A1V9XYH0_9ACAR|nr:hypothetical protein BIW11_06367 [Tropilaelaps mercedesae]
MANYFSAKTARVTPAWTIRDFWSTCIRAVPVAKECHPAIEARIEEFESSMVGEIECVEVDTRLCPHIEGHHHYHSCGRGSGLNVYVQRKALGKMKRSRNS